MRASPGYQAGDVPRACAYALLNTCLCSLSPSSIPSGSGAESEAKGLAPDPTAGSMGLRALVELELFLLLYRRAANYGRGLNLALQLFLYVL